MERILINIGLFCFGLSLLSCSFSGNYLLAAFNACGIWALMKMSEAAGEMS